MAQARSLSIQMLMWTRHNVNALHVYCRLIDFGFSKSLASKITRIYELFTHCVLY